MVYSVIEYYIALKKEQTSATHKDTDESNQTDALQRPDIEGYYQISFLWSTRTGKTNLQRWKTNGCFREYKLGRSRRVFASVEMLQWPGCPLQENVHSFKMCALYFACVFYLNTNFKQRNKQNYSSVLHDGTNRVFFTYLHFPRPNSMPAQCLLNLIKLAR